MFSEIICNRFTEVAYLPRVVFTVLTLLVINKAEFELCLDVYKAQEMRLGKGRASVIAGLD